MHATQAESGNRGPVRTLHPWVLVVHDNDGTPIGVCRSVCPDREHAQRDVDRFAAMGLDCRAVRIAVAMKVPPLEFVVAADRGSAETIRPAAGADSAFRSAPCRWSGIEGGEPNRVARFWVPVIFKGGQPIAVHGVFASRSEAEARARSDRRVASDTRVCEIAIELTSFTSESARVIEYSIRSPHQDPVANPCEPGDWHVIARKQGAEIGRTLFMTEVSRERAEQWLAANPQPDGWETLVVDDCQPRPFIAPRFEGTQQELFEDWALDRMLDLARRGKDLELPAMERQVRNIVLAILENAVDLDADTALPLDNLLGLIQDDKGARDEIREEIG